MGRIIAKRIRGMNWMAKVSLILVFILTGVLVYNVYLAYAAVGEGRMVYNINTTTPQARVYNVSSNTFPAAAVPTVAGGIPKWMKIVSGTRRNEAVVAYSDTSVTSTLRIVYWNGTAWSSAAPHNWTANLSTAAEVARSFDVAVEQLSGDIIVAYTTNAAGTEINFRRWDGATWTVAAGYDSARLTGTVRFIKMESKPNSDDIALIMADTNNDLSAAIWNGTTNAWGNAPGAVLTNDLAFLTAGAVGTQSFDLAYESLTGDLLVAYATDAEVTGLAYNTFSGGIWSALTRYANMNEAFEQVDCASDPLSDKIICAAVGDLTDDMRVGVWDGAAWQGNNTDIDVGSTPATYTAGRQYLAVGWLNAGSTKQGIIVYNNNNVNAINWVTVNIDGTFTVQADNTAATPMSVGGIAYHDIIMDPFNPDRLLFIFQDTTNFDIFAKRLIMDATPAFTWSDANAGAVITAAPATAASEAFHFAYDRDITPPVAGTVTVSPDFGGYTSSSPTITTVFTDNESAVTSCEYTTNNGTNWFAGVVSGTKPNFTCTANPTGLSGALTINMRATSSGGTTTATAISRTVDATAPTDGVPFTVTPGGGQNALSWTVASDAGGSGLRTGSIYNVRYLDGATPPTCSTGTSIYTGDLLAYTHTGLTGGQQYSYRVCAYDNVNNASAGATGSGTAKLASTIVSCAGCHGYGAITDGTPRNTPAGTFPGSHNKHVVQLGKVCNVCHVVPATETSVDFKHRNSNIQLKTEATAIDGGYYDKNNDSIYNAGDDTFAQTNAAPSLQTCRTVYCHSQGTGATSNLPSDPRTVSAPLVNLNWGSAGACNSCHGYGPSYVNGTPKANSHSKHQTQCSTCHNTTTTDSVTITNPANHVNKLYNIAQGNNGAFTLFTGYTYAGAGGSCTVILCHNDGTGSEATRQWGTTMPATYKCTTCHTVTQAITVGPLAGTGTRSAVVSEFGLTWGHKSGVNGTKLARAAVTDADCIVCHLEGNYTTQLRSTYHGDGYIDLRDPDGAGETRITDISLVSFRFAKFSTSYAAGMRYTNGHTLNNIDNILTQKFCLKCHDSLGAQNTTARTAGGTATMPFGNVDLGANYTVANGAAALGDLVNVNDEFATTNTSVHPVRGPRNKDFPTAARLASPYNTPGAGRTDAGHGLANSVVINCFDCHNASTPLTDRTIVAHGNANTIRGTIYVTGPTLCTTCHIGYTTDTDNHLAGSAGSSSGTSGQGMSMSTFCMYCHASADAKPARPLPAQDFHGYNRLVNNATWTGSAATGGYPYGFIRNTSRWIAHKPYNSVQWGVTTATCQGDGTHCAGNGATQPYTPGGTY